MKSSITLKNVFSALYIQYAPYREARSEKFSTSHFSLLASRYGARQKKVAQKFPKMKKTAKYGQKRGYRTMLFVSKNLKNGQKWPSRAIFFCQKNLPRSEKWEVENFSLLTSRFSVSYKSFDRIAIWRPILKWS